MSGFRDGSYDVLLKKLIETMESNNELLTKNNKNLEDQNEKMLKYTKAIYILTAVIVVISILGLIF